MKKKIVKQPNISKHNADHTSTKSTNNHIPFNKSLNELFQKNYQLIARTINETLQKPNYSAVITKILQREPSIELISFQQIQKNLVFQQYLQQYTRLQKFHDIIKSLIPKHLPHVKANYMDFKIKNFTILNKYKVTEKVNLPYPLSIKFQKLTDSKMSSTKSVENKVLHQLEKQIITQKPSKRHNIELKQSKSKKIMKNPNFNTQRFQIKALTKNIGQMIQNIKDVRALEDFKKQMEKISQFKFGISNFQEKQSKFSKKTQPKEILKLPKKHTQNQLKEKQFKRKLEDEMVKYFPQEKKSPRLIKNFKNELNPNLPLNKGSKSKLSFKSTERLQTNPDPDVQEYGLSVIRQKRKKSKSREYKSKSKSKDNSKRSKQKSSYQFPLNNKRLQTEYSSGSTQRLNTGYSILAKSKSGSRIPTEYDSTVIVKGNKSRSKLKEEQFMFANLSKKDSKSSSISSQVALGFKKSKSKSKLTLLQFNSPNKIIKK